MGLGDRVLVLASSSPRRAEMLRKLGIRFQVRTVPVEEIVEAGEKAADAAVRLAGAKAQAAMCGRDEELVVGADTVVVVDGEILGKPSSPGEAQAMLKKLSGRDHEVLTGLALIRCRDGTVFSGVDRTRVSFRSLSQEDIEALVSSGEALDKAGAYGIQGLAALVVERIEGDYNNVVGLPLGLLRRLLHEEASK